MDNALASIDVSTLILLYALMIFSAQFRLGGLYTRIVIALSPLLSRPAYFLAAIMAGSAATSALLVNDIVCLAFTPVIIHCCFSGRCCENRALRVIISGVTIFRPYCAKLCALHAL